VEREKKWWMDAVVYQIYPRSFKDSNGDGIGDIPGIIEKLDYLMELGIDVIWLSPVYDSPNDDNGYDIRHYEEIAGEFGTMADMEKLIKEAHTRGIKIVMDLVVNHTSDEHPWFVEAKSSKNSPKRDFYIWRDGKADGPPNNWGSVFGGSAWEYNDQTGDFYLHLFSKKQPDLNWENKATREAVYDMMNYWVDKGIDGFRMDVINFISKDTRFPDGMKADGNLYGDGSPYFMNGPRIHEFLQEIHHNVLDGHDLMTVGEMPGVTVEEAKLYTGPTRNEVSMVFHFEHMGLGDGPHGKWDNLPWKLTDLKQIMAKWQVELGDNGWNSLYWNNHDQPRVVSRFGNDGKYRVKSAKMLATCLHMMKGTPYIYQGEELGMTNIPFSKIEDYRDIETLNRYDEAVNLLGKDPEEVMISIQARGRDNARTPMQWDNSSGAGFTSGEPWIRVNPNYQEINAKAALDNPKSIFYHYQKLIALRHKHDIVKYGDFELLLPEDERVFAYLRRFNDETWLIVCNFSDETIPFEMPVSLQPKKAKLIISSGSVLWPNLSSLKGLTLNPYDSFVFDVLF
jgi:oligo-1,6-glucosidase